MRTSAWMCAAAIAVCAASAFGGSDDGRLFWSNRDSIQTSELDGGNVQTLVSGSSLNTAADVEVDVSSQHVYVSDIGNHTIKRMNFDGSGVQTVLSSLSSPIGMELDLAGQKLYWSDRSPPALRRSNLDGSGAQTLLDDSELGDVYHFDLDVAGGYVYWSARASSQIRRAPLDGGPIEVLATVSDFTHGLALDLDAGHMYFTEGFRRTLWRANLDGSGLTLLHTFPEDARPLDLELDPIGERLYLSDNASTRVWRVGLDGGDATAVVDLADPPPANLLGVAVVPVPEPAAGLAWLTLLVALRRRDSRKQVACG